MGNGTRRFGSGRRGMTLCLGLVLVSLAISVRAVAQLPTATILGVVNDASGAVIPGASLVARNVETGQTRTTVAGGDGAYRFSALPVGNYEVRAEHPGFQSIVRGGLTLTISQEAVVNITLDVGAVEQAVAVTAEAPLVNTTSGSLGGLVDEQKIADLPLNGRNYINLALLQPGVMQHKNSPTTSFLGTWFSSNGAPLRSNNILLDGAIMSNQQGMLSSITGTTLGVEGIREYRVVTNSFSAEYGIGMGSQTVIVSKGGTNRFHGTAFEFLRNNVFDARNFFDYSTAAQPHRLPPYKRNQFGGSFGGPIKKDKTFFFAVYEGLRERLGITTVSNVIPASAKVDGGLVPQIAPVIKPLLTLFPDPNLPKDQFTYPFSQPNNESYGQIRLDHSFSAYDSVFARYTIDDANEIVPLAFPVFSWIGTSQNHFVTLSENHIFSSTLLNTARFSYSRDTTSRVSPSGIIGPQFSFVPGQEIGGITIGGVSGFGPNATTPGIKVQNYFTYSDDLFYTRGRHSLKFGALINRVQQYASNGTNSRGAISFANINSFLLGQPTSVQANTVGSHSDRTYFYSTLGFYAQDDLRVTPRLTLNLGFRYEFMTQPQEVRGLGAALRNILVDATTTLGPPFVNPSLHNFSPRIGFAWDMTGNGKTALRGGFGIPYDITSLAGTALIAGIVATPPFSSFSTANPPTLVLPLTFSPANAGKALRTADYHQQSAHMLQYNLTVERQLPFDMSLSLGYVGSRGLNLQQVVDGNPTVPQILPDGRLFWPVGAPRMNPNWTSVEWYVSGGDSWYNALQFVLKKRLRRGLQFESSYTWSKLLDQTQTSLTGENTGTSDWVAITMRPSVDKSPAAFDATQNWRLSTIYRLPTVTSSATLGKLLNGWWTSGILSFQSGYPFTPNLSSNRSRTLVGSNGGGTDRPDLVPGRNGSNIVSGTTAGCPGVVSGQKLGTPNLYFDPCAFTMQPAGFFGTSGRDILRGPGLANLDFSLVKDTSLRFLGESGALEFRAELFNILNRVNFGIPSGLAVFSGTQDVGTALANTGKISQTSTPSRQVQFALKLIF